MMKLNLGVANGATLKVLCLGSHSDDIEIGCGGTILRLIDQYPTCRISWVVFSAVGIRKAEAQHGAGLFAGTDHLERLVLKEFPDGFMPYVGSEVKSVFEDLKKVVAPDVIFTHQGKDAHQDHRLISELTWNTFRDHLILEYEIPKYDGDLGRPSVFVSLNNDISQRKVHQIVEAFPSQHPKRWFEENTFLSLMRLRGMECNAPSGYAEAFYGRKIVI
jgi:LmbE family N-acetylglucosaminyl deacetylase